MIGAAVRGVLFLMLLLVRFFFRIGNAGNTKFARGRGINAVRSRSLLRLEFLHLLVQLRFRLRLGLG